MKKNVDIRDIYEARQKMPNWDDAYILNNMAAGDVLRRSLRLSYRVDYSSGINSIDGRNAVGRSRDINCLQMEVGRSDRC